MQLALSESMLSDKVVLDAMENVLEMFQTQKRRGWYWEETTKGFLKHYVLFKYSVEDIQYSEMETRYLCIFIILLY